MQTEYISMPRITASEGHIITNGKNYARVRYLHDGESTLDYYEITQAEYEAILAEQEKQNEQI